MILPHGNSRVLTIVGDPVAHSLSPAMQNAAIAALGLDAIYIPFRVPADSFPQALETLVGLGVAGNVTVPHKVAAVRCVAALTPTAKAAGAINTFWSDGDGVHGDNTDVAGVLAAVDRTEAPGPWLTCGTGGAARAVALASAHRETALLVRSRSAGRAGEFVDWARGAGADAHIDDDRQVGSVFNATLLGMHADDPAPLPPGRLDGAEAAIDLVYTPGETSWIRECRDRGLRAVDGRVMLVGQGIAAFERFFPGQTAPRDVMSAAVERALRT